jgi:hypothetical protein
MYKELSMTWSTNRSLSAIAAPENDRCQMEKKRDHQLYMAVMISAACLIVVLCLISRRKNHARQLFWGFPSIAIPLDGLGIGASGYRLLYCVIMGSWGADLLTSLLNTSLYYSSPFSITDSVYFFMFTPTVIILSQSLAYFPVFACVDTPLPILGHLLGLLYTSLLVSSNVYSDYAAAQGCSYIGSMSHREVGIFLGSRVWTYFLYLCMLLYFFLYAVFDLVQVLVLGKLQPRKTQNDRTVCEAYVRHLLRSRRIRTGSTSYHLLRDNLWNYLIRGLDYVLPNAYTFCLRYPLPLFGAFFMGFSMIIHLVIFCSAHEYLLAEKLLHWLQEFQITVDVIEEILPSTKPTLNRLFQQVLSFAKAYEIILPLGSIGAFGFCGMFSLYMLHTTYKQMTEAARGDTGFFVRSELVPSLVYRLAATMRFTAFQVAFLVCTWMIYCLLLWILLSIGLLFYYLFNDFRHFGVHFWSWFMVPMMWGAAMYNLQLFLCKYVFLERTRGTLPLIRLRWLYDILAYFLFFFNGIFGFVMCILRGVGVVIFTAVMLFRLDWDIYMRGLEGWDTGHRTYMAYMYVECTYNNTIMRLFVHLLLDSLHQRRKQQHNSSKLSPVARGEGASARSGSEQSSHRARLHWYLAYTLLRNPTLCRDRVTHTSSHSLHPTPHTSYGTLYTIN